MDNFQVIILALLQGITEFLPISSSAHLILPSAILGWPDQGLVFDVAVHLGTLLAVIYYFRATLIQMTCASVKGLITHQMNSGSAQLCKLIVATLPAVVVGFLVNRYLSDALRGTSVIAIATIVFGLLLWFADNKAGTKTTVTVKMALIIGLFQCLALIPGTSRSGITMTAALLLGLNRSVSAEFSFLLSIPLIMAASCLKGIELLQIGAAVDWNMLLIAIGVAFLSALTCIYFFLSWIQTIGFKPFVIYRLLLGGYLLWLIM